MENLLFPFTVVVRVRPFRRVVSGVCGGRHPKIIDTQGLRIIIGARII